LKLRLKLFNPALSGELLRIGDNPRSGAAYQIAAALAFTLIGRPLD